MEISLVPMIWHWKPLVLIITRQLRSGQVVGFRRSVSVAHLEGFRLEGLVEDLLAGLTGRSPGTGLVTLGVRRVGLRVDVVALTAVEATTETGVEDQSAKLVTV